MMENALKQVRDFNDEFSNQISNLDNQVRISDKSSKNHDLQENDIWLSMEEVSNLLGVSEAAVRKAIKAGKYQIQRDLSDGRKPYRIALSSLSVKAQALWAERHRSLGVSREGKREKMIDPMVLPESERAYCLAMGAVLKLYVEAIEGVGFGEVMAAKQSFVVRYNGGEWSELAKAARTAEYGEQMRVVIGVSGIGKTTAVQYLAETVPGVIVVEAYQGMTKKAFMQAIAKQCGAISSGGFTELFHAVVEALRGSERLIVVDEAEHLPVQALDAVRRVHDFTRCGVLMVGLPRFYELLANRQREYGYIYNRTGLPVRLKKLNEEDVRMLVETVMPCNGYAELLVQASRGVARDLKTIVFESLRVADENGVGIEDKAVFASLVKKVQQELNRREG